MLTAPHTHAVMSALVGSTGQGGVLRVGFYAIQNLISAIGKFWNYKAGLSVILINYKVFY